MQRIGKPAVNHVLPLPLSSRTKLGSLEADAYGVNDSPGWSQPEQVFHVAKNRVEFNVVLAVEGEPAYWRM